MPLNSTNDHKPLHLCRINLSFQCYGSLVAAGAHDGDLLFWDVNTGKCEGIVLAHAGPLHCISFHGTRFVTGGGYDLDHIFSHSICFSTDSVYHEAITICNESCWQRCSKMEFIL